MHFIPQLKRNIKADHQTIIKSLEGNWRDEQLFLLAQCCTGFRFYKEQIATCDAQVERTLAQFQTEVFLEAGIEKVVKKKQANKNKPKFDTSSYIKLILGVDTTEIYGISDISALEILSETETEMSKWETEKQFVSWLNLCPNNKISGGKLISSMLMKKKPNPASQAFRHAANAVRRSNNWLGDYCRRMKAKGGNSYAIVATAHKIATIYYKMVKYKQPFVPVNLDDYQRRYKQAKIAYLKRRLLDLNQQVA